MGSRIAAHLANAGIPTLPLDVVSAERKTQERIAFTLRTGKPQ
jgi:3-hydroxyacyl-CoA dehydrogenase